MTNKNRIKSFRDLEVYQNTYKASVEIAAKILPKLPDVEKYDLYTQLSKSSKAIPRLIAEGFAKKHQKHGFQKYIDDAMAECNETIVILEHIKDIYKIEVALCNDLIEVYDKSARQLYNLALAWDSFKNRRKTKPNDDTGGETVRRLTLNHIALAVKNISDSLKIWQELFGFELLKIVDVPEQKVKVAILELGDVHIELLEPLNPESTVAKFIEKKGEGLHHLAFEVEDIEQVLRELKDSGVKLIDEKPRKGAMDSKIAFIHPSSTGGVLVEICEA